MPWHQVAAGSHAPGAQALEIRIAYSPCPASRLASHGLGPQKAVAVKRAAPFFFAHLLVSASAHCGRVDGSCGIHRDGKLLFSLACPHCA